MKRLRLPDALAMIRRHFAPLRFFAQLDSLASIQVMLLDEHSGESLVLTGVPCSLSLTERQLAALISAIELDVMALRPSMLNRHRTG